MLLHFGVYALFENELDPSLIWRDLGERRAMALGIGAMLLLIPWPSPPPGAGNGIVLRRTVAQVALACLPR
ncbi:MAG: hypothetical protein R2932_43320 [Caldilineaceae bacterium]